MENILVPTDFSTGSLQPVARLAEAFPDRSFSVTLYHPFNMPDSIQDLLMLQRSIPVSGLFSDAVRAECRRLKQQYGNVIRSIVFRPVYGAGAAVLGQVIEAGRIDTILYDETYPYAKPHYHSADIKKSLKKAPVAVLKAGLLKKNVPVKEPAQFAEYAV